MGSSTSKALKSLVGHQDIRLLMVGLDAAGKTTSLYKLKLGEIVTTIPTIGFNVETVDYKNIHFTVWDVSGRGKIRALWRHYFQNTQGVIFVIDSNDRERMEEAKDELWRMMSNDELRDAAYLILANKQDLPNAMSIASITEALGLHAFKGKWYIQATCATTGDGLYEGLEWLSTALAKNEIATGVKGLFWSAFGWSNQPQLPKPEPAKEPEPEPKKVEEPKKVPEPQKEVDNAKQDVPPPGVPSLVYEAKPTTSFNLESLTPYAEEPKLKLMSPAQESEFRNVIKTVVAKYPQVPAAQAEQSEAKPANTSVTEAFENCDEELDKAWSHLLSMYIIWHYLVRIGRKDGVKRILKGHEKFLSSKKHGVGVFHMTITYFWIQIVDFCLRSSPPITPKESLSDELDEFLSFYHSHEYLTNDELFLQYYSVKSIFHEPNTMTEFTLPDIKPLPSIVTFQSKNK